MATWGVAAAKAKFSEVIDCAQTQGMQEITRNGKVVGMMISPEDLEKRTHPKSLQNTRTMSEFFRKSPLAGSDIDLRRSKSKPRRVDL